MNIQADIKFHNRFEIVATDVVTGETVTGTAENIVLNRMYNYLCAFSNYFAYICYGGGTGTPTPERTTLFTPIGAKGATDHEIIRAFPVSKWTRRVRLELNDHVGAILTEVGISDTTNAINTHAMISDSEGNPISIEKTNTRIIDIYATVYAEFPTQTGSAWSTQIRDYLIGGASAPGSNVTLRTSGLRPVYSTRAGTITQAVADRKRNINCQFDNYRHLGNLNPSPASGYTADNIGVFYRRPYLAVDELWWDQVGKMPFTSNMQRTYDYVVSEAEAAKGCVYCAADFDNLAEVYLNGVLTTDYTLYEGGKFEYADFKNYITKLADPTDAYGMWANIRNGEEAYLSYNGSGSRNHGFYELLSDVGFNLVVAYDFYKAYGVPYVVTSHKDQVDASFVTLYNPYSPTVFNTGNGGSALGFGLQTAKDTLRLELIYTYWYGDVRVYSLGIYMLPILKFNTPLVEGDIVTIKANFINKIPKDNTNALDVTGSIQFGEGV